MPVIIMGLYNFKGAKQDTDYTWQEFGRELILTEDLDPVYTMLANAELIDYDLDMLKRWLLAYWCYYNVGVASFIAEGRSDDFFERMWMGIHNKWPRGMERRYFWGKTAINVVRGLESSKMSPEAIVDHMTVHTDFYELNRAVVSWNGFGPWMGWKIADMAETVLRIPVDFSVATLGIYRDPVQGAAMVAFGDWRHPITEDELQVVVDRQVVEFSDLLAPPYFDRRVNIQEVETNLCKFKAHYKHHYPIGNDTYHVHKALVGWGDLADDLLLWVPKIKPGHKGYKEGYKDGTEKKA